LLVIGLWASASGVASNSDIGRGNVADRRLVATRPSVTAMALGQRPVSVRGPVAAGAGSAAADRRVVFRASDRVVFRRASFPVALGTSSA